MKFLICVLVFLVGAVSCTVSSLLPFHFNPFQSSSNNAESTTTYTINEITTEFFENDQTDPPQIAGIPEMSNSHDGQEKIGDLPEALATPLHILQLLLGPHDNHPNGQVQGMDAQPPQHQQELLPGLPGLPIQLPISLIQLPNLIATNSKQTSSDTNNSGEKRINIAKN